MARPRNLAPWMALALELGFEPARIQQKVRHLRWREAKKFEVSIPYMEAVYGWTNDEMAMSLLHAIEHERCRGPRCGRVKFRVLIPNTDCLSLITGDILDPDTDPLFCINFKWCCARDNSGDRDSSMRVRAERLVTHRLINIQPINIQPINIQRPFEQTTIFDLLDAGDE